jgi:hypothetical protein
MLAAWLLAGCQGAAVTTNAPAISSASSTPATSTATLSLQGTPPSSITAGSNYSFRPSVTESGGTVSFTIVGQPAWASFNPATGALSGTPTAGDVGTTGNITISASNGGSTASIGPFAIQVFAPGASTAGTATLSWVAPTQNIDGTPITNLAGFRIYYGTSAGALSQTIDVAGPAATTYALADLAPGTYYFVVTAYNTAGIQSAQSSMASKTI